MRLSPQQSMPDKPVVFLYNPTEVGVTEAFANQLIVRSGLNRRSSIRPRIIIHYTARSPARGEDHSLFESRSRKALGKISRIGIWCYAFRCSGNPNQSKGLGLGALRSTSETSLSISRPE
ncbi:cytochrome c-type biogenesis protein CcmE [Striga asiatica]|uniref:Cytochrome c-type biogenesis protein CcmE n=1 Tax=Striga asiatica TaxID=4170 RepID=A0A5A7QMT0_STRAF|nr:cytochrome c-type biogenesis protein CcmE [Striga asiatica]